MQTSGENENTLKLYSGGLEIAFVKESTKETGGRAASHEDSEATSSSKRRDVEALQRGLSTFPACSSIIWYLRDKDSWTTWRRAVHVCIHRRMSVMVRFDRTCAMSSTGRLMRVGMLAGRFFGATSDSEVVLWHCGSAPSTR